MRSFLKKLALSSSNIVAKDWESIPYFYEVYEYVHINILVSEARFYTLLNTFLFCFDSN